MATARFLTLASIVLVTGGGGAFGQTAPQRILPDGTPAPAQRRLQHLQDVRSGLTRLERVDEGVGDADPLASSLRQMQPSLREPGRFDDVYRVPGRDDLLMRIDGGLYAVFPRSEYHARPAGQQPAIPGNVSFAIGVEGLAAMLEATGPSRYPHAIPGGLPGVRSLMGSSPEEVRTLLDSFQERASSEMVLEEGWRNASLPPEGPTSTGPAGALPGDDALGDTPPADGLRPGQVGSRQSLVAGTFIPRQPSLEVGQEDGWRSVALDGRAPVGPTVVIPRGPAIVRDRAYRSQRMRELMARAAHAASSSE